MPTTYNFFTSNTSALFVLTIIVINFQALPCEPRRKNENGWRPPLPPQNLTQLTSGVDSSTGKAWIQIGWQPPPEQQHNISNYRSRLPVTRYRITWHHRPSHTGALTDDGDVYADRANDEEEHNPEFLLDQEESTSAASSLATSKLRSSSIHELRKMVHQHQTSFTVDSLEPGEVYTVYLQAFGEREHVKLRSVRISRKFRAPLLPPDYKTKNVATNIDDKTKEEDDDDDDNEEDEQIDSAQLALSSSEASTFASILIGTPYYEYGFLKLNVSWQFDAPSSSIPVLLKWRPEVCLDQSQSAPTFQHLQSQLNDRKNGGTSSAVAFGTSYIVTGLRFACRYALSLEPKFDVTSYAMQTISKTLQHNKKRRHSVRHFRRSSIRQDESDSTREKRREVVKHFETPSCVEVKVVGNVEPPCVQHVSEINSHVQWSSNSGNKRHRHVAAPFSSLPPPPRDFTCQLTMPSLQPSPTSATCWWQEPIMLQQQNQVNNNNNARALRLSSNNSKHDVDDDNEREEAQVLKSRVIGYKLWHALVGHAADLELARAGKRKRRREAAVYMKLLTQDELSFTLASLKPSQTYIVELQTVVAADAMPAALSTFHAPYSPVALQHHLVSAPVRRIIHVPSSSSSSSSSFADENIHLNSAVDDERSLQFTERYGSRSAAVLPKNSVITLTSSILLISFFLHCYTFRTILRNVR